MPKIKICGITSPTEAEVLNEVSVDFAGFVFFEKSKRNITIDEAKEILKNLNASIKKVAVMVSPNVEMIRACEEAGFDILQIHKSLSMEVLEMAEKPIWYAVNIEDDEDFLKKQTFVEELPERLSNKITAIVVDAPSFGAGKPFNWRKSKRLKKAGSQSPPIFKGRMFVLAGGLNPTNVSEGISIFEPDIVDVSSGVEAENTNIPPGKDEDKIISFVKNVRDINGGNNE